MDNLEGRFQELFLKHRGTVVQQTMGPDYRKDLDPEEPSRHFIDLELYGEFPFSDLDLNYDGWWIGGGRKKSRRTEPSRGSCKEPLSN